MNKYFSVLVNTSDGFEDCWAPFFLLRRKYWPNLDGAIFLNTELKNWSYTDFDITCTKVQKDSENRQTWSECLLRALEQVETPIVLYMQEDYFIHSAVNEELVAKAVDHMIKNPEVKHIGLSRHGSKGPHLPYKVDWLLKIRQNAQYRISTQAGLWRLDTLKSYIRPEENGWMFEIYGTWRAHRQSECFLCVAINSHNHPAIEYLHTGIIKGKWLQEICTVFKSNDIDVDFTKRGFYIPKHWLFSKFALAFRILEKPSYFMKQLFIKYLPVNFINKAKIRQRYD